MEEVDIQKDQSMLSQLKFFATKTAPINNSRTNKKNLCGKKSLN